MALTVPKAGMIAGRSADIQIATPEVGAQLNGLGEVMLKKGLELKAEQQRRQGVQAQLAITRELGMARQEIEQTSDPDVIGPAWDQRVADIRGRYITEDMDPVVAEGVGLTIQELGDRHALALGNRTIGLRQSQYEADWIDARAQITTDAATADPDTLGALVELGDGRIADRLARGVIDPATAATERQALRADIFSARSTVAIEKDPGGFIAAAEAGEYNYLDAETLATRKVAAQNELDRRAAAAAAAAKVEANAQEAAIGKRLTEMSDLMVQGFAVTDEEYLKDPAVASHPGYGEAVAAQALRNEIPNLRTMTPAEIDAQIEAERAAPKTRKYQVERLKLLTNLRDTMTSMRNTDAVAYARQAEMNVPDLPAFDPADPSSFGQGLGARLAFDDYARRNGYTQTQAVFSLQEKSELKTILDPKADPAPKLALARTVLQAGGAKADRALQAMEADPVFARATKLIAMTGSDALSTEILRGQQKLAQRTVAMPSAKDQTRLFDEITGGAFDGAPALKGQLLEAAGALYADDASGVDPDNQSGTGWMTDSAATDLFTRAVQRVTGATTDANGNLTVGGVQQIGDAYVSLPPGLPAAEVETSLEKLDAHLRGQRWNAAIGGWDSSATDAPPDPLRAFKAASIDDFAPDLGSNPRARFSSLQLHRVGESQIYEFRYTQNGRSYTVRRAGDPQNGAFRFRLPDLVREAGK